MIPIKIKAEVDEVCVKTVLLVGTPNSGKTAIFNKLSGKDRKVANYSGISVDLESAELKSNDILTESVSVIDLPGMMSLNPRSYDEVVTTLALLNRGSFQIPYHLVVVVIDYHRLESGLTFFSAIKRMFQNNNIVIVFNKCDRPGQKDHFDSDEIKKKLGVPYLAYSANLDSFARLDNFLRQSLAKEAIDICQITLPSGLKQYGKMLEIKINDCFLSQEQEEKDLIQDRMWARNMVQTINKNAQCDRYLESVKIDKYLLHPFFGGIVFVGIFYFIFHALYSWSGPLMDFIDQGVGLVSSMLETTIPEGLMKSFLLDGIVSGVGGVIVFLPQIMILFFLLSLLEQSGYIARASVLTDKIMSWFGLNGRAFLPMMSGFACSVPAIMATRTIRDRMERLATLMVIPLVTCSARLPVFLLLVGTFVPKGTVLGIFDRQALSFFLLYFSGTFVALIFAKLFRLTLFKGRSDSFIMDLPYYQRPSLRRSLKEGYRQGKVFLKKVGTVILAISIVIWILSTFPKAQESLLVGKTAEQVAALELENSTLGRIGKMIEPVILPLGYDWRIGIGILVSFGARELFVSTMGTIFALGDVDENSSSLQKRLQEEINPRTGGPLFSFAVAWSLMIFFAFSIQCISTLAVVWRETESMKYTFFMFSYMTTFSYLSAFGVYQLLS